MITRIGAALGLALGLALDAAAAAGQSDSAAAARAARDAQASFEVERVRLLPPTGSAGDGRCDERLGRMCLTHDEGEDWWPTPERPEIAAARARLLRALADAQAHAPGDRWILGQRVLYLGEAGRWEEADSLAAAACAAHPDAWCLQLEGLALHELGRFVQAEARFRAALERMGPDSAHAWLDPGELLDPTGRAWWKRAAAHDAGGAERLVWALADPLLLVPGNDQLTEQWARRTVARAREDARNPYALRWGDDLDELLLRYGTEVGWERALTGSFDPGRAEVVTSHHDPESRPLMPPGAVLVDPAGAPADAWTPDYRRPRSTYAPAYGPTIVPADAQIALFPRGDRFALVGAYALPADTTFHASHGHHGRGEPRAPWAGAPAAAGLFLMRMDGEPTTELETRAPGPAPSGALVLEAPAGRWVASVEVLDPSVRRAGRLRAGIVVPPRPADEPSLSDLLLVGGPVAEGAPLEQVASRALPRSWVRTGERVGLVWELFGFRNPREELAYVLTLERARARAITRAIRRLGLLRPAPARRLEWREPAPDGTGPALRSVELDLAELEPGAWVVRLEIRRRSGAPLIRERPLELRAGSASSRED